MIRLKGSIASGSLLGFSLAGPAGNVWPERDGRIDVDARVTFVGRGCHVPVRSRFFHAETVVCLFSRIAYGGTFCKQLRPDHTHLARQLSIGGRLKNPRRRPRVSRWKVNVSCGTCPVAADRARNRLIAELVRRMDLSPPSIRGDVVDCCARDGSVTITCRAKNSGRLFRREGGDNLRALSSPVVWPIAAGKKLRNGKANRK